ncbi:MAG: N-acetylmuramoyl-L-alanine amidase [Schleiferiaceae bacterium]|nr:N-acetylmuramoyl-L-alanine amidase [Schleiferiaceae bacterium]
MHISRSFSAVFLFFFFIAFGLMAQEPTIYQTTLPSGNAHHLVPLQPTGEEASLLFVSLYTLDVSTAISGRYRTKTNTAASEWQPLPHFHDGPLLDRQVFVLGDLPMATQEIEFSFSAPLIAPMFLRQFSLGGDVPFISTMNAAESTCACDQPSFCDRTCWCPSGNCDPVNPAVSIVPTHGIVHHSAGNNNSSNWPGIVLAIWDFHVNTNGWDDVGYNWLIDPNGNIYEGRGSGKRGAHFSCMNGASTGICLIGNYSNTPATSPAIAALEALLTWETCDKNIAPGGISMHQPSQQFLPNISGHRDGNGSPAPGSCASGTVCPGDSLYEELPQLSLRVAENPCFFGGRQEKVVLSAAAIAAPSFLAGETLNFFGQQTYLGFADSLRHFEVGVYWSADAVFSATATRLFLDTLELDSSQRSHFFSGSFTLPTNTPQGTYYLHFIADHDSVLAPHSQQLQTLTVQVSGTVSAPEQLVNTWLIYPNPTEDYFSIQSDFDLKTVNVYNLSGQHLHAFPANQTRYHLHGFASGHYIVELITTSGNVYRARLVLRTSTP